ncbi:MAG TPA: Fmu (Sun) domain-containing protein [Puia sp.]
MKFDNQLRYAATIIASYQGEMPLHTWLKNFFREHKQMGSKDRRLVSNMVYGFYRLGHALRSMPAEERVLTGLFLCYEMPGELLQYFRPDWNERIAHPLPEKIAFLRQSGIDFEPTDIFPWKEELSEAIDHETFCLSFLRQPDLFLRIRPGHEKEVLGKLAQAAGTPSSQPSLQRIPHEFIPPFTLRLPNGFKVEEWFTPDKEVVIQDYSSQKIATFLQIARPPSAPDTQPAAPLSFWDACAASGGKSILAFDLNPRIDITVSDIRESILRNLRERFRRAGIKKYHSFVANLAASHHPFSGIGAGQSSGGPQAYDLILADVPCSGSGTWSRTPEELYFFDPKKILHYSSMQKKIVANILPQVSKGACFVYSTCSVFRKENEEIAALIRDAFGLQPDRMENIKGYDQKADSMFAARFRA